jgi:hypothetical protein
MEAFFSMVLMYSKYYRRSKTGGWLKDFFLKSLKKEFLFLSPGIALQKNVACHLFIKAKGNTREQNQNNSPPVRPDNPAAVLMAAVYNTYWAATMLKWQANKHEGDVNNKEGDANNKERDANLLKWAPTFLQKPPTFSAKAFSYYAKPKNNSANAFSVSANAFSYSAKPFSVSANAFSVSAKPKKVSAKAFA